MNIKVQIKGQISTKALIASGDFLKINFDVSQRYLTFIAFSDTMKARVLEMITKQPEKDIKLTLTNESTIGEWYED